MLIRVSAKSKNSFKLTTPSAFESKYSKSESAVSESLTDAMKSWQMSAWSSSKVMPPSPLSVLQIAKPGTKKKRHRWYFWEKHKFNYLLNAVWRASVMSARLELGDLQPHPKTLGNNKLRRAKDNQIDFMFGVKNKVTYWRQLLALFIPWKQVFQSANENFGYNIAKNSLHQSKDKCQIFSSH